MGIEVQDPDRALYRMVLHAMRLLQGSTAIEDVSGRAAPGGYLLQLIALEILLKAGALQEDGRVVPTGHRMAELFELQSESFKKLVQRNFEDRELALAEDVGAPLREQIAVLGDNFVKFRYVYEAEFPYGPTERVQREQDFVDGTLPAAEWDVVYHLELLDMLLTHLLHQLTSHRKAGFPELRWEQSEGHSKPRHS